ncbi:5-methylcytosine-specific restriction endonuclease McrA [Thermomonospora echinospora]|uniref:5-methylcytosine-specific restriction endonuclease McrA n=1 Tax=Thermomonospora echinospora TaxID=1992 RepID=A0A1H5TC02_9ACTN|nr:HNH endonuclease [Thermomonospora echinospora]SEF59547.1 5-methylcytosine-specific restriction endonuclease McrA [Thermomonospora echinospora]
MNVLVLNASYEPLQQVDLRHAIRMLVRGVAVVEEAEEGRTIGSFPVPRVLRLVRYVAMRWRYGRRPPWSKRGVHLRDRGLCGYCGRRGHTIDHVVPQSRGGADTWENTVLACGRCNNRKGSRTPAEAGLRLRVEPRVPRWDELIGR